MTRIYRPVFAEEDSSNQTNRPLFNFKVFSLVHLHQPRHTRRTFQLPL